MSTHRIPPPERFVPEDKLPIGPNGRRCCRWCKTEVPPKRRTFCSPDCVREWSIRQNPGYAAAHVLRRDHGVCAICHCDTNRMHRVARWAMRFGTSAHEYTEAVGFGAVGTWRRWWEVDHIVPVVEGGGECGLDNLRTLCIACHKDETAKLRRRMTEAKRAFTPDKVTFLREHAEHLEQYHRDMLEQVEGRCSSGHVLAGDAVWIKRMVEIVKGRIEMAKKASGNGSGGGKPSATLDCEFKGVSIGKDKLRLSVAFKRDDLELEAADRLFTGSQLNVNLSCDPNGKKDVDGQKKLADTTIDTDCVVECHGFRVASDRFSASLSMPKKGSDVKTLSEFANCSGKIKMKRTGDATPPADDAETGDSPTE